MMWLVLICASFFELAFTVCMKLSNGLKNVKFTVLTVISSCASIGLLSVATKTLPLGVSYAVWTGLGTLFNVLFGIIVFKESKSPKKLFFMAMVHPRRHRPEIGIKNVLSLGWPDERTFFITRRCRG